MTIICPTEEWKGIIYLLYCKRCVLEVVLCKANPGLVPFQAGRVKVALAVELLGKKSCHALGTTHLRPPEVQEFHGLHWNSVAAQPELWHQTWRAVGIARNELLGV